MFDNHFQARLSRILKLYYIIAYELLEDSTQHLKINFEGTLLRMLFYFAIGKTKI